jgi:hypothetical protein
VNQVRQAGHVIPTINPCLPLHPFQVVEERTRSPNNSIPALFLILLLHVPAAIGLNQEKFQESIMVSISITRNGKKFGSYKVVQIPNFYLRAKNCLYFLIRFINLKLMRSGSEYVQKFPGPSDFSVQSLPLLLVIWICVDGILTLVILNFLC